MQLESNQVGVGGKNHKLANQIGEQMVNLNRISNKPSASHCGYCESNGSYSWGLTKQIMHPLTYQLLAERGWRRCGTYYYKPDIKQSCCKLWTHRLDTSHFKIKKDQKKAIRQVVDWLLERMGEKKTQKKLSSEKNEKKMQQQKMIPMKKNLQKNVPSKIEQQIPVKWNQISLKTSNSLNKIIQEREEQFFSLIQNNLQIPESKKQFCLKIDTSKIKCFISQDSADSDFYSNHLMVLFGLNKKLFKKQYKNIQFVKDIQNFVLKYLKEPLQDNFIVEVERSGYLLFTQKTSPKLERKKKRLQISEKNKLEHQMKLSMKKSTKIKESEMKMKKQEKKVKIESNLMQTPTKFQFNISPMQICFGPLSIQIVPAEVTTQSWRMYQRYSTEIHQKDEKSKSSYSGFLCEKALKYVTQTIQSKKDQEYTPSWQADSDEKLSTKIKGKVTKLMGCYHMKYFIEKQLIGVGVIDLLPEGLSSVYFFYEPKYKDYRLGVFSSLVQIQYVRWLSLSFPEFKYYYMGFYVQNSQKMKYKGNYEPFDLMCPITYQFVECNEQLKELINKIQKKQIDQIQLSKSNDKISDMNFTNDIGVYINQTVKIKYEGKNLSLKDLNPRILIAVLGMLRDMVQVWGKFLFEHFTFTF